MRTATSVAAIGAVFSSYLLFASPAPLQDRAEDPLGSTVASPAAKAPTADAVESVRVHVEIPRQSLETYVRLAADIVRMRVLDRRVVDAGGDLPLTCYRVQVLEALKGVAGSTIEIRVAGGETARGRVHVEGAPTFEVGDEAIVFLTPTHGTSWYGVLGLEQGAYRIEPDAQGALVARGIHTAGEAPESFLLRALDTWIAAEKR